MVLAGKVSFLLDWEMGIIMEKGANG